jgi:thiosulfate dehydrogenase [quinone] large subunit
MALEAVVQCTLNGWSRGRVMRYSRFQVISLITLRMLIGWHFLYEGLAKITNPYWTSAGYLDASQWWFSGLFRDIAASPTAVTIVDYANMWGLALIGLGLLVGFAATIAGVVVLVLYYVAVPPFVGYTYPMPTEGSYLVVNKVLIEAAAMLLLLAFPTGNLVGLDRIVFAKRRAAVHASQASA